MFKEQIKKYQKMIDEELLKSISESDALHGKIFEAMRYSLNAGGKRIRPILVLEFARISGVSEKAAMPFALALEMIHTYSLIHDDLPCMDDDDLRRGRPTSHKVFGEAVAVLAGDALLNYAFEYILNNSELPADLTLKAMKCLAEASGSNGMIGGQIIDMEGENRALTLEETETLQSLKTGALIRAGALIGCIIANADENVTNNAKIYADNIGLAFQIKDDILNVEGDPEIIGKDVGNDEASGKSTFVKLIGIDSCKERVLSLTEDAKRAATMLPDGQFLVQLADELVLRDK